MTLEELEKRMKVLEDVEEIKRLQATYLKAFTSCKWDEMVDCFAEDGVFDAHAGIAKGKKAVEKIFKEVISLHHIGEEGNFAVQPIITVDGDKAKGSWLLYVQFALPRKMKESPSIFATDDAPDWTQGFYDMEYIRENGKWKFSYLKYRCRLISPLTTQSSIVMEVKESS